GDIVDPVNDPQDDPGDDEPDVEPLPGLPDYTAGYTTWLRMNAKPIPPTAADPHNGTKNVYVNQERAAIAPNNRQEFPYPDGSILVKESTRQGQDFIWLFAIMRKVKGSDPAHGDWEYTEYIRIEANADFRLASRDGICWGCHFGAAGSDWSFTTLDPE
ncbi:MAG: cytochrome P460 family protein, partial [Candidatus Poribacteria bacterium]|nr:cytochrome P460 family protein [Candidatus Poribacteria bacterium]